MATVHFTTEAREQERRLPRTMQERLKKVIKRLKNWPAVSGVKAHSGNLAGRYRIRFGDYRVRFRVEGGTVTIERIGHRKDIYED